MTHIRNSKQSGDGLPATPVIADWDTVEERAAAWERWAHDEAALPDAALDAALVQLLDQIRHSL
jgi:hypothetical protein